jgi:hypothetical protein
MSRRVCFDIPSHRQQHWTEPLRLWARNALRAYWLSPVLLAAPPDGQPRGAGSRRHGYGFEGRLPGVRRGEVAEPVGGPVPVTPARPGGVPTTARGPSDALDVLDAEVTDTIRFD